MHDAFPLPASYVEHLVAPRHIGDLEEAHAAGQTGSMVGGLGLRITVAWGSGDDGEAIVKEAAGRAFGSAAPLPVLSWLCDRTRGCNMGDALEVTPDSLLAALTDGRPGAVPSRIHLAATLAVNALQRSLGVPGAGKPAEVTGPGILVCRCLGVGDLEIRSAIRDGAHEPEDIGELTHACTGCRSCRPDLLQLIDEELRAPLPVPDVARPALERITLARCGAMLRGLGFELEDAKVCEGGVAIAAKPAADREAQTTVLGAVAMSRHLLREVVHEDIRVEVLD